MQALSEFFSMGGHGFYIWSAYGLFVGFIAAELLSFPGRRARAVRAIEREARARQMRGGK